MLETMSARITFAAVGEWWRG